MAAVRSKIIGIAILLIAVVLGALSVAPLENASSTDGTQWMSKVDDSTPIRELSIPGTHDSGALHSIADVSGKCQTLGIRSQLDIGVRLLDIRLKRNGERLCVVHSFVDQAMDFSTVMDTLSDFLKEHPSETLFVSIKEDTDASKPCAPFGEMVESTLGRYGDIVSVDTELPETLGDARGKIFIISRYTEGSIGLPAYHGWQDSTSFELDKIFVQDNYSVDSVEEKLVDVRAAMAKAASGEYALVLNFASCYLESVAFPPTYAGTPAHDINAALMEELEYGEGALGVILCDFITSELAEAIYGRNFK